MNIIKKLPCIRVTCKRSVCKEPITPDGYYYLLFVQQRIKVLLSQKNHQHEKTLLLFSLIGLTIFSYAQTATLGIKAGVNFSSLSVSTGGSSSSTTGFNVGAIADFNVAKDLSIQPGVFFTTKGGSAESNTTSGSYTTHSKEDLTLNYLEVPVNVLYHIPVSAGKIFVGGGPYIALGLSGKDKYSASATSGSSSSSASGDIDVTFGSSSGDVKNPDFGINFMGGIKLQNNLLFSIGYGLGLANLSNMSGTTTQNRSFNLSVGYFFK